MIYFSIISHISSDERLLKFYLQGFQEIYNSTSHTFENVKNINRRICLFKAFTKRQKDKAKKSENKRATKKRQLSSKAIVHNLDAVLDECIIFSTKKRTPVRNGARTIL